MSVADAGVAPAQIPRQTWRLAWVLIFGSFMSGLDASVVNVGIASIARSFEADIGTVQWIATAYLLALAVALPGCAWLGRRVGLGHVWLGALGTFTVASALCALAPSIEALIALRVLQGLAAGMMIPTAQTLVGQQVGARNLGRLMATIGVVVTIAPTVGPTVGGLVLHVAPWPWLFLLNVPIGIVGLLLALRYVPRGTPRGGEPLDWPGLLLMSTGIPLLIYGFTAWGERGTLATPLACGPLLAGLLAVVVLCVRARTTSHPLLDLRLWRVRAYAWATVTAAFTGAALYGAALLYPLYFVLGRDASAMATGIALLALGAGTAMVLPLSGRLVDRFGGGVVSAGGGLAAILTTLPFALLEVDADLWLVELLLLLRGMAIAFSAQPAAVSAMKAVRREALGDAVTQVNILQRVGGALGGAIFAIVLAQRLDDGAQAALHVAFLWLVGASAVGLATALFLAAAERRPQPAG